MEKFKKILKEIKNERLNQDIKWGPQDHDAYKWIVILAEEVGEAAKSSLEYEFDKYRAELIQVAAVAIAAIECLDKRIDV